MLDHDAVGAALVPSFPIARRGIHLPPEQLFGCPGLLGADRLAEDDEAMLVPMGEVVRVEHRRGFIDRSVARRATASGVRRVVELGMESRDLHRIGLTGDLVEDPAIERQKIGPPIGEIDQRLLESRARARRASGAIRSLRVGASCDWKLCRAQKPSSPRIRGRRSGAGKSTAEEAVMPPPARTAPPPRQLPGVRRQEQADPVPASRSRYLSTARLAGSAPRSLGGMTQPDLSAFVKAYDVRGLVGSELTEEVVEAIAAAFVDELGDIDAPVIVGHDMRDSSPSFAAAFARGANARGADVVSIGLCSTGRVVLRIRRPGRARRNVHGEPQPRDLQRHQDDAARARGRSARTPASPASGTARRRTSHRGCRRSSCRARCPERDVLADYAAYLRSLVPLDGIRPLKVVVDAGNGMAGLTVPAVLGTAAGLPALPLDIVPMYFELDGTFPNHEANPLEPANLVDLQKAVVEHGADLGLAFDGDADRCFVIDQNGDPVGPSAVAAIVALREIQRVKPVEPAPVVLHNLITSRIVPETIESAGATPVRTRVGHSFIKDQMAQTGAVFGGEHSAHYYFRDFWGADNGMLAAMHVIAELGHREGPLSELGSAFTPYSLSGEINSVVSDVPAAYARIVEAFTGSAAFDELDGLTVTGQVAGDEPWWWFNVRPSNTEPLLRLNVEAQRPPHDGGGPRPRARAHPRVTDPPPHRKRPPRPSCWRALGADRRRDVRARSSRSASVPRSGRSWRSVRWRSCSASWSRRHRCACE